MLNPVNKRNKLTSIDIFHFVTALALICILCSDPLFAQTDDRRRNDAPLGSIKRQSLPPIGKSNKRTDGGLPRNLWKSLSVPGIEKLLVNIPLPAASPTLQKLLSRAAQHQTPEPKGSVQKGHFLALKLEILFRIGQLESIINLVKREGRKYQGPVLQTYYAWALLGTGYLKEACAEASRIPVNTSGMPTPILGKALMLVTYCAAANGRVEAARLTSELARDQGIKAPIPYAVLDRIASGVKSPLPGLKRISLRDYVFMRLTKWKPESRMLEHSEPALLIALAHDKNLRLTLRLRALERAVKINAADAKRLADIYGTLKFPAKAFQHPMNAPISGPKQRALIFQAIKTETSPLRKERLIIELLKIARREELYTAIAKILAKDISALQQTNTRSQLAGIMIEALLAAGYYKQIIDRTAQASGRDDVQTPWLLHWLTLVDIAQSEESALSDAGLKFVTRQALAGQFQADVLHRLVTVLDALAYNIPIPLWNAASRTPQPKHGHLPETGHLSRLQKAAKNDEIGRTILMAMTALGPQGPVGAHMIALGDTIKALKTAGLEAEARQIGFEALFAIWPRANIEERLQ